MSRNVEVIPTRIPIIDCSGIFGPLEQIENDDSFKEFTEKLGDFMSGVGFVYFINHGVKPSTVEAALEKSKEFFLLPKEIKKIYKKKDPLENFNGFNGMDDEIVNEYDRSAKDYKECFDIWGIPAHDKATFPKEVPGFKAAIDNFRDSFRNLAKKVFRSFALYLDLDDTDFFINKHKAFLEDPAGIQSHNLIRSNFYPPIPADSSSEINENTLRLTEHSDLDTCSFLFQDEVGGLEAKMTNGEWVPVPPIKDSIVFNTGFCLELWSGGVFPSTMHRVRFLKDGSSKMRQSIGCFVMPDGECNVAPVVDEKEGWTPTMFPRMKNNESHFTYFLDRMKGIIVNPH